MLWIFLVAQAVNLMLYLCRSSFRALLIPLYMRNYWYSGLHRLPGIFKEDMMEIVEKAVTR